MIIVGLRVHVRPDGLTVEARFTVPLKPLTAVMVIVDVPELLASNVTDVGLALMLKSVTWTVAAPVLVLCIESGLYVPVMDAVPVVVELNVTEQLPPTKVHVEELKVPRPVDHVTVPVGVVGLPTLVSATVAVHVEDWPMSTLDGVQVTVVLVLRGLTVMVAEPVLAG